MSVASKKSMALFVLFLFFALLAFAFAYNGFFSVTNTNEVWVTVFVCLSTAVLMMYLLTVAPLLPNFFIAVGLFSRVIWLFVNRELWVLVPWLGSFYNLDSNIFHSYAMGFFNNIAVETPELYGFYPHFLNGIYLFVGADRMLGSFVNTLFSIFIAILLVKLCELLNIGSKGKALCVCLYLFIPFPILYSVGTFREQLIILPFVLSLYFFFRWFQDGSWAYAGGASISILFASYVHAGVAPALAVYLLFFVFWNRKEKQIRVSFVTLGIGITILMVFFLMPPSVTSVLFDKISRIKDATQLFWWLSFSEGNSAYLEWIDMQNIWDLLWVVPFKFFYFWCSPVPWEWRGLQDAAAFLLDSLIYVVLLIHSFHSPRKKGVFSVEWIALALIVLGVGVIYAGGTFNAGTATRHRLKLLPVLTVFAIYSTPSLRTDAVRLILPPSFRRLYDKFANPMLRRN